MNYPALKYRLEFSFYRFTGEKRSVAKTLNKLYVFLIIIHIVSKFESPSLNSL